MGEMSNLELTLLIWAVVTVPGVVLGWWGVFRKAGLPAWAAFVPGYNLYLLVLEVAKLSLLWFVLCLFFLLPPIQIIAVILVNIEVAKRFGRTESYGIGLSVFGFVFYPLLGFGSARYRQETIIEPERLKTKPR